MAVATLGKGVAVVDRVLDRGAPGLRFNPRDFGYPAPKAQKGKTVFGPQQKDYSPTLRQPNRIPPGNQLRNNTAPSKGFGTPPPQKGRMNMRPDPLENYRNAMNRNAAKQRANAPSAPVNAKPARISNPLERTRGGFTSPEANPLTNPDKRLRLKPINPLPTPLLPPSSISRAIDRAALPLTALELIRQLQQAGGSLKQAYDLANDLIKNKGRLPNGYPPIGDPSFDAKRDAALKNANRRPEFDPKNKSGDLSRPPNLSPVPPTIREGSGDAVNFSGIRVTQVQLRLYITTTQSVAPSVQQMLSENNSGTQIVLPTLYGETFPDPYFEGTEQIGFEQSPGSVDLVERADANGNPQPDGEYYTWGMDLFQQSTSKVALGPFNPFLPGDDSEFEPSFDLNLEPGLILTPEEVEEFQQEQGVSPEIATERATQTTPNITPEIIEVEPPFEPTTPDQIQQRFPEFPDLGTTLQPTITPTIDPIPPITPTSPSPPNPGNPELTRLPPPRLERPPQLQPPPFQMPDLNPFPPQLEFPQPPQTQFPNPGITPSNPGRPRNPSPPLSPQQPPQQPEQPPVQPPTPDKCKDPCIAGMQSSMDKNLGTESITVQVFKGCPLEPGGQPETESRTLRVAKGTGEAVRMTFERLLEIEVANNCRDVAVSEYQAQRVPDGRPVLVLTYRSLLPNGQLARGAWHTQVPWFNGNKQSVPKIPYRRGKYRCTATLEDGSGMTVNASTESEGRRILKGLLTSVRADKKNGLRIKISSNDGTKIEQTKVIVTAATYYAKGAGFENGKKILPTWHITIRRNRR